MVGAALTACLFYIALNEALFFAARIVSERRGIPILDATVLVLRVVFLAWSVPLIRLTLQNPFVVRGLAVPSSTKLAAVAGVFHALSGQWTRSVTFAIGWATGLGHYALACWHAVDVAANIFWWR